MRGRHEEGEMKFRDQSEGGTVHAETYDSRRGKMVTMEQVIMEGVLGRDLRDNEQVIHLNGNTLDNRRANLSVIEFNLETKP